MTTNQLASLLRNDPVFALMTIDKELDAISKIENQKKRDKEAKRRRLEIIDIVREVMQEYISRYGLTMDGIKRG